MKIKLDENLGDMGADLLTEAGHDVSTVLQQQISGIADTALYDACRSARQLLVTLDRDFGEVLRFPPETTPGIAILACQGRLSPPSIRARIKELVTFLEAHPIDGRLWIVEPGRLRIHGRRDTDG
jgi:predicted nuclease of predicted toxin-antitoxin system